MEEEEREREKKKERNLKFPRVIWLELNLKTAEAMGERSGGQLQVAKSIWREILRWRAAASAIWSFGVLAILVAPIAWLARSPGATLPWPFVAAVTAIVHALIVLRPSPPPPQSPLVSLVKPVPAMGCLAIVSGAAGWAFAACAQLRGVHFGVLSAVSGSAFALERSSEVVEFPVLPRPRGIAIKRKLPSAMLSGIFHGMKPLIVQLVALGIRRDARTLLVSAVGHFAMGLSLAFGAGVANHIASERKSFASEGLGITLASLQKRAPDLVRHLAMADLAESTAVDADFESDARSVEVFSGGGGTAWALVVTAALEPVQEAIERAKRAREGKRGEWRNLIAISRLARGGMETAAGLVRHACEVDELGVSRLHNPSAGFIVATLVSAYMAFSRLVDVSKEGSPKGSEQATWELHDASETAVMWAVSSLKEEALRSLDAGGVIFSKPDDAKRCLSQLMEFSS